MMPCCRFSGLKYLNDDLSIDDHALSEAIDKYKLWHSIHSNRPIDKILMAAGQCKCDCHVKNINVMH